MTNTTIERENKINELEYNLVVMWKIQKTDSCLIKQFNV